MANKVISYKVKDMVITIDRSKCISCGACTSIAPNTFELDSENFSVVKNSGPYDDEETIKDAVNSCPTEAIKIKSSK